MELSEKEIFMIRIALKALICNYDEAKEENIPIPYLGLNGFKNVNVSKKELVDLQSKIEDRMLEILKNEAHKEPEKIAKGLLDFLKSI